MTKLAQFVSSICLVCMIAQASIAQSVTIGDITANAGDSICLDVTVDAMGNSHDNTSIELSFPPELTNLTIDGTGSIYGAGTFTILPTNIANGQAPVLMSSTADGLAYSVCFDVDAGAAPGDYPVSSIVGLNTGLFFAGDNVSTTVNPGTVTIVPEPGTLGLLFTALVCGLAFRRKR